MTSLRFLLMVLELTSLVRESCAYSLYEVVPMEIVMGLNHSSRVLENGIVFIRGFILCH